jgi:hypothetical protein
MKDKPAAAPESHSQKPKTHLRITDLMSRWVYTRRGIEKLIRRGLLPEPQITAGRSKLWHVADIAAFEATRPELVSGAAKRNKPPVYQRINFRVSDAEHSKIEADAAAQALTVGGYIRWLAIERPETRPTRRPLAEEVLLRQLKAEAGRVDGNLAQFLKLANRGEAVPVEAIADAANAVRDFFVYALEKLREA